MKIKKYLSMEDIRKEIENHSKVIGKLTISKEAIEIYRLAHQHIIEILELTEGVYIEEKVNGRKEVISNGI